MPSGIYRRTKKHKQKLKKLAKSNASCFKKGHKVNAGKKCSQEKKQKISKKLLDYKHPEEVKRKIGKALKGKYTREKSSCWKGGTSFEPYCVDWTEDLKRAVRKRDKYTCQILECRKEPAICVHHIDYDKKNCNLKNLVTLCSKCHGKTSHDRKYWIKYFKNL